MLTLIGVMPTAGDVVQVGYAARVPHLGPPGWLLIDAVTDEGDGAKLTGRWYTAPCLSRCPVTVLVYVPGLLVPKGAAA
jgi:hypothetical protein